MDSSFIDNADDETLIQTFLDLDGDFDLCVTQGDRDRHTESMQELHKAIEGRGYTIKTVGRGGWKITRK